MHALHPNTSNRLIKQKVQALKSADWNMKGTKCFGTLKDKRGPEECGSPPSCPHKNTRADTINTKWSLKLKI